MEIRKSHITGRPLPIDAELSFTKEHFENSYPIRGMKSCHVEGEISKHEGLIEASLLIEGVAILEDSYTAELFDKKLKVEGTYAILEDEDGEAEGFIVPGKVIELESLCLSILRFSLPIKVLKKGSKLPEEVAGVHVYKEGEEHLEDAHSSPFDALADLDLPDHN